MQIQKRVLELFAVIESPILVFSAQKELIYALWPRFAGAKHNGQSQRQEIMARAQQLLSTWQYNVGDPLFLAQVDAMGGILLPHNVYVLIGPILPIKVTVKHKQKQGAESIVDYVENRTACLACNMWLSQMREQSKYMVHEYRLPDELDQGAKDLEASALDEELSCDLGLSAASADGATGADSTANAGAHVAGVEAEKNVSQTTRATENAGNNSLTGMAGVDSAIEVGIESRNRVSYMTLEQFVAGKGIDEGNWDEDNWSATYEQKSADDVQTKAKSDAKAKAKAKTETETNGLGQNTVPVVQDTNGAGAVIAQVVGQPHKQAEIDSLLQSLSGQRDYDFSQIYAAQNEPYNPMDGSSANESWAWDEQILELLHLDHIGTVHHHNQLRNEVLVQEAVREGDVEKLRWAYNLAPKGKSGVLGLTPLRSWKNHAHISNIFASRAAIDAGISPEEAYTLSDKLFLAVESIQDPLLAKHMRFIIYRAFTEQVRWHRDRLQQHASDRPEPLVVQKARFLLQQQLFTDVSLQGLAEQLGCSAEHLARCFKGYHGQSVMQYLRQERLTRAKELLRESNTKICDIAALLHFASSAHFCQAFKAQEHLSPAKWRALYAKFTEV